MTTRLKRLSMIGASVAALTMREWTEAYVPPRPRMIPYRTQAWRKEKYRGTRPSVRQRKTRERRIQSAGNWLVNRLNKRSAGKLILDNFLPDTAKVTRLIKSMTGWQNSQWTRYGKGRRDVTTVTHYATLPRRA